ncbi:hypothetical protein BB560_007054 [Smittium megazygosporum]|uniref:Transcription factor TFIIB cyclin-like domain-containing protein n=1 Tax=Smittium megazygosporum TaxID=133381 RepID=A0A2T9XZ65_9FUNG|nr:hypothetical protein BB560_007054 [Smittium megazygosporum]
MPSTRNSNIELQSESLSSREATINSDSIKSYLGNTSSKKTSAPSMYNPLSISAICEPLEINSGLNSRTFSSKKLCYDNPSSNTDPPFPRYALRPSVPISDFKFDFPLKNAANRLAFKEKEGVELAMWKQETGWGPPRMSSSLLHHHHSFLADESSIQKPPSKNSKKRPPPDFGHDLDSYYNRKIEIISESTPLILPNAVGGHSKDYIGKTAIIDSTFSKYDSGNLETEIYPSASEFSYFPTYSTLLHYPCTSDSIFSTNSYSSSAKKSSLPKIKNQSRFSQDHKSKSQSSLCSISKASLSNLVISEQADLHPCVTSKRALSEFKLPSSTPFSPQIYSENNNDIPVPNLDKPQYLHNNEKTYPIFSLENQERVSSQIPVNNTDSNTKNPEKLVLDKKYARTSTDHITDKPVSLLDQLAAAAILAEPIRNVEPEPNNKPLIPTTDVPECIPIPLSLSPLKELPTLCDVPNESQEQLQSASVEEDSNSEQEAYIHEPSASNEIWDVLYISEDDYIEAVRIYDEIKQNRMVQSRRPVQKKTSIIAAILFILCRNRGYPRTFTEICNACKVSKKDIGMYYKLMQKVLDPEMQLVKSIKPEEFINRWCKILKLPDFVPKIAADVYHIVDKLSLVPGKCPIGVSAACVWLIIWYSREFKSIFPLNFEFSSDVVVSSKGNPILSKKKTPFLCEEVSSSFPICTSKLAQLESALNKYNQKDICKVASVASATLIATFKMLLLNLNRLLSPSDLSKHI